MLCRVLGQPGAIFCKSLVGRWFLLPPLVLLATKTFCTHERQALVPRTQTAKNSESLLAPWTCAPVIWTSLCYAVARGGIHA